jgi:hypothetical protein
MRLLETHAHLSIGPASNSRAVRRDPVFSLQPGSIGEALETRERSDTRNQGRSLTAVTSASTRGAILEAVCNEMEVKGKGITRKQV